MKNKFLMLSVLLTLSLVGCQKTNEVEDIVETTNGVDIYDAISELDNEATPSDSKLETSVAEETIAGGIIVSEDESKALDDIIVNLRSDVEKEPIDTEIFSGGEVETSVNAEQEMKDKLATEWKDTVRESLGVSEETTDESDNENVSNKNTEYDSDGDLRTREIELLETEAEKEINDAGEVVETLNDKIEKAKEKSNYKGIQIVNNSGDSMKLGKIYNYFVSDGTQYGSVGDYLMCGQLGIAITPALASTDVTASSSNNKVIIQTEIGVVEITKLKEDFDVEKMSVSQIQKLSGLSVINVFANATKGSYSAYSMFIGDKSWTNAVQYYSCPFGTYEFKYMANRSQLAYYLFEHVYPTSTLNDIYLSN